MRKIIIFLSLLSISTYSSYSFADNTNPYGGLNPWAMGRDRGGYDGTTAWAVGIGVAVGVYFLFIKDDSSEDEETENTDTFSVRQFEDGSRLKLSFAPTEQEFKNFSSQIDSRNDNTLSLSLIYQF